MATRLPKAPRCARKERECRSTGCPLGTPRGCPLEAPWQVSLCSLGTSRGVWDRAAPDRPHPEAPAHMAWGSLLRSRGGMKTGARSPQPARREKQAMKRGLTHTCTGGGSLCNQRRRPWERTGQALTAGVRGATLQTGETRLSREGCGAEGCTQEPR